MTFIPPEPHKFYYKKNYRGEHYIMLIDYDPKYNWWTVEHMLFGKRHSYKQDYETIKKEDGWTSIPEREYWEAMDRFGRLLSGKAATNICGCRQARSKARGHGVQEVGMRLAWHTRVTEVIASARKNGHVQLIVQ